MSKTTPPIVIESRRATKKLALFTLLGALPVAVGAILISHGDSVLWAQIERALTPVPDTLADVAFDFPGGWTNNPNGNVIITDCDCIITGTTAGCLDPAHGPCWCDGGLYASCGDGDGGDSN